MKNYYPAVILTMAILGACGSDSGGGSDSGYKLGDSSYMVVDGGTLSHKGTSISGVGSVAFVDPTKNKDNSYAVQFDLQDNGSLSLTANAAEGLKNGITIKFTRSGSTLAAVLQKETTEVDISSQFKTIDATKGLSFQVDIHNSESPTHILVWSGSDFSEANAIFNSENGPKSPGQGSGNIWGFVLKDASVSSVTVSGPKFEEE